jgi:hypothetical protein
MNRRRARIKSSPGVHCAAFSRMTGAFIRPACYIAVSTLKCESYTSATTVRSSRRSAEARDTIAGLLVSFAAAGKAAGALARATSAAGDRAATARAGPHGSTPGPMSAGAVGDDLDVLHQRVLRLDSEVAPRPPPCQTAPLFSCPPSPKALAAVPRALFTRRCSRGAVAVAGAVQFARDSRPILATRTDPEARAVPWTRILHRSPTLHPAAPLLARPVPSYTISSRPNSLPFSPTSPPPPSPLPPAPFSPARAQLRSSRAPVSHRVNIT